MKDPLFAMRSFADNQSSAAMVARWTPNYAPDPSASALFAACVEAIRTGKLRIESTYELRQFLDMKRNELDLQLVDLIELRQYAHRCAQNARNQPERSVLFQSVEQNVAGLIMDFGCAISS